MPPQTFSDTAITNSHSDITFSQLRAHRVRIAWSVGSEKIVATCAAGGSRTLDFLRECLHPIQVLCLHTCQVESNKVSQVSLNFALLKCFKCRLFIFFFFFTIKWFIFLTIRNKNCTKSCLFLVQKKNSKLDFK